MVDSSLSRLWSKWRIDRLQALGFHRRSRQDREREIGWRIQVEISRMARINGQWINTQAGTRRSVGSSSSPASTINVSFPTYSKVYPKLNHEETKAAHNQSNTSTYANIISTINQILVIMQSTVPCQPIPSLGSMAGKCTYVVFLGFACLNFQNTPMEMLVCQLCSVLSKSQLYYYRQFQVLIKGRLWIKAYHARFNTNSLQLRTVHILC